MPDLDYQQAIDFAYSLAMKNGLHLPLKRMTYLLDQIGNPQRGLRVIHITGTSGKGSVAAFVAEILYAAGYRVGVNASPHLQVPIERMRVGERYISPQELAEGIAALKPLVEEMLEEGVGGRIRLLEMWTVLVLRYFRQQQVDYAVVEVGAGGRYDCTNVVEPVVAVIVTVDYDHQGMLGSTIPEIAHHKAGIIKNGVPVVTAARRPEAMEVIERECVQQGSFLARLGREFQVEVQRQDRRGARFDYRGARTLRGLEIEALGAHQVTNAATAVATIEAFERHEGVHVPQTAIRAGLAKTFLPGRLEIVQEAPTVVLDGAHNEQKIAALVESLKQLFGGRRLILVLGMLGDKNAGYAVEALAPLVDRLVATAPYTFTRPVQPPEGIARRARAAGLQAVVQPTPLEALDYALAAAGPDDVICVTGSMHMAGQVRERWVPSEQILETRTSRVQ